MDLSSRPRPKPKSCEDDVNLRTPKATAKGLGTGRPWCFCTSWRTSTPEGRIATQAWDRLDGQLEGWLWRSDVTTRILQTQTWPVRKYLWKEPENQNKRLRPPTQAAWSWGHPANKAPQARCGAACSAAPAQPGSLKWNPPKWASGFGFPEATHRTRIRHAKRAAASFLYPFS